MLFNMRASFNFLRKQRVMIDLRIDFICNGTKIWHVKKMPLHGAAFLFLILIYK